MRHVFALCTLCVFVFFCQPAQAGSTPRAKIAPLWVTAYYAGWSQGYLTPDNIDFSAITHLVHFSVLPQADGTLNTTDFYISPGASESIIRATHAAKRKILLCVGGGDSAPGFRPAIAPKIRAMFIKNLLEMMTTRGYDGLDIDFEPLEKEDSENFIAFIRELHAAMHAAKPHSLLTCAVGDQQDWYLPLQDEFDQINIMTYDQSGSWDGWETWHNSSLLSSGLKFKSTHGPLPSTQLQLQKWLNAGFKPAKLGIGLAFYGKIWQGATGPNQSIAGVTVTTAGYHDIMTKYFKPERYRWDENARAPYLSIDEPGTANDFFISYDDEKLTAMKVGFAREKGLGGVIIWELGSGYRADAPAGERDVLLQTVKRAATIRR